MPSIALVDLKFADKKANRDHTGGFGSYMQAQGFFGKLVSGLKSNFVELPVLHLGYLQGIFRKQGWDVRIYDGATQGEDIILIASSMHCYKDEVAFARETKKKYPKSKIGFFGPFVMTQPQLFEADSDFLIHGEVEATAMAFFEGKHDFTGKLNFGLVTDLNQLPIPDWTGVDIKQFNYFPLLHLRPFMSLQSSRGCSFNCDFCPYMVEQTKKYRMRSPKLVVDEIESLVKNHGVRSVLFRDICFTLNKKHAEEISREIMRRNLKIEWACETRVDCLNFELIDIMYESGFRGVNFGIETGNLDILKESGKKAPQVDFQKSILDYLQKKGVRINAFYMLGLVGDTAQSMQKTIDLSRWMNTMGAQFCTMTPFPGTPLFEDSKERLMTTDFAEFDEYRPVVNISSATPQEVVQASQKAYGYYFRFNWLKTYGFNTAYRFVRNTLRI